jgi:hypothetical protein
METKYYSKEKEQNKIYTLKKSQPLKTQQLLNVAEILPDT